MPVDVRSFHAEVLLPKYITTSKKDRAESGLKHVINRNQVLIAYLLLVITVVLVTATAVKSLHRVTIIGWHIRASARVDNMVTKEALRCLGIYRLANKAGWVVTDDKRALKKPGRYLFVDRKLDSKINKDIRINLVYYKVAEESQEIRIPYQVLVKKTHYLLPGQKRIVQKGRTGVRKDYYYIVWQNGKNIQKKKYASRVVVAPRQEIIQEGVPFVRVSRGVDCTGLDRLAPKGTFLFTSTAYTHTGSRTATGIRPRKGMVAVDPQVIPLGTKMFIPGYGYAVAADTGGAIKGRKLDVFFETRAEALKWGKRCVKVTILG